MYLLLVGLESDKGGKLVRSTVCSWMGHGDARVQKLLWKSRQVWFNSLLHLKCVIKWQILIVTFWEMFKNRKYKCKRWFHRKILRKYVTRISDLACAEDTSGSSPANSIAEIWHSRKWKVFSQRAKHYAFANKETTCWLAQFCMHSEFCGVIIMAVCQFISLSQQPWWKSLERSSKNQHTIRDFIRSWEGFLRIFTSNPQKSLKWLPTSGRVL